jgi:hypothetical protein
VARRACPDCDVVLEPVDHVSDHRGNGIRVDDPENGRVRGSRRWEAVPGLLSARSVGWSDATRTEVGP